MLSPPHSLPRLLAALLLLSAAVPAQATVVSGQVTDPGGNPIPTVDLDFKDLATGLVVPTPNDDTDLLGFYAVDVPPGTYDIQYEPAAGDRFVAFEDQAVVIGATPQVLDQTLEPGFLVTARIVDPGLLPVDGGRLDVRDLAGNTLFSHLDRAGADGRVNPIVPAGTWDFKFSPAAPGSLLPVTEAGFVISADHDFGDVVLPLAFSATGRVVGSDGPPLDGARVEAIDVTTGLLADGLADVRSDATGRFELQVPPGDYRLDVSPAFGAAYQARGFHGLNIAGITTLPDLPLDRAAIVDGRVIDQRGRAVEAADLDFDESASGTRFVTVQDDTDPNGSWQVVLPFETYDVSVDPPLGSTYAPAELEDVVIDGDRTLPDLVLLDGFALSARVLDPGGLPAAGVNVDVRDAATGVSLALDGDRTDVSGRVTIFVPPGTWNLRFRPPALSGWGLARRDAVPVSGDTDLGDVMLPAAAAATASGISPINGPEAGGTLVLVTGSGFVDGARVLLDGQRLKGVVVLDASTIQGTTRAHHRGWVGVEVVNPGASPSGLPVAFSYEPGVSDPLLLLRREGPFGNDLMLEWSDAGRASFSVYRSDSPWSFGRDRLVHETGRRQWRDEGGILQPGLLFYVVH